MVSQGDMSTHAVFHAKPSKVLCSIHNQTHASRCVMRMSSWQCSYACLMVHARFRHEPTMKPCHSLQGGCSITFPTVDLDVGQEFFVNRHTCSQFMHTQCPCYTNAEFFVLAENDHDKPTTVFHLQIVLVKTVCPKLPPVSLLHVYKPAGLLQLPRHDDQILKNATCLDWQDCSTATA